MASLNALHTRLNDLETENSIARRRVRELEYELEQCKRDVVRERTRIMEDGSDVNADPIPMASTSRAKGKERRQKDMDPHASKYFEVVQEKKGNCELNHAKYVLLMDYSTRSSHQYSEVPP